MKAGAGELQPTGNLKMRWPHVPMESLKPARWFMAGYALKRHLSLTPEPAFTSLCAQQG